MTETSRKKRIFQIQSVCNAEHSVMCALRETDFCGEMRVEVDLEAWIDF